jgi:hypothetical protein
MKLSRCKIEGAFNESAPEHMGTMPSRQTYKFGAFYEPFDGILKLPDQSDWRN